MDKVNKTEIIYTRIEPDERDMLIYLKDRMVRSRSDVIRFLIRQEYERLNEQEPTNGDGASK
jgi:hypothetical protein